MRLVNLGAILKQEKLIYFVVLWDFVGVVAKLILEKINAMLLIRVH